MFFYARPVEPFGRVSFSLKYFLCVTMFPYLPARMNRSDGPMC